LTVRVTDGLVWSQGERPEGTTPGIVGYVDITKVKQTRVGDLPGVIDPNSNVATAQLEGRHAAFGDVYVWVRTATRDRCIAADN
jgi:hypothetical protein